MKRIKGSKIVTQYFINYETLEELFKSVPPEYRFESVSYRGQDGRGWRKLHISDTNKNKLGISSVYESIRKTKIMGEWKNMSRKAMLTAEKSVIEFFDLQREGLTVQKIILNNGEGKLYFRRCKKNIVDPKDKRKRIMVLGLVGKVGAKQISAMADLSTGKVSCQFADVIVRQVVCSEVK